MGMYPLSGAYEPHHLKGLYYGPETVSKYLLSCLPTSESKAFIVTGSSLATNTPLIERVEELLSPKRHLATFSSIKQHAPIDEVSKAMEQLRKHPEVDTIISIGGGSPIDSAKTLIFHFNVLFGRYLTHIAIPTVLSAAECTDIGGTTMADGVKQGVQHARLAPQFVLYDPEFALYTPPQLFMSTGIRAMDHAIELQYNSAATWMPCKAIALRSISNFFELLPRYRDDPKNSEIIVELFLSAHGSLGFFGKQMRGSLGLSHTIGYALGSPYGIPHGVTSCLTLGNVVKLKGRLSPRDAKSIASILPYLGRMPSGNDVSDSERVGDCILQLVKDLGLHTTLSEWGVNTNQIDIICNRALGAWMPGEERKREDIELRDAVRNLVLNLY